MYYTLGYDNSIKSGALIIITTLIRINVRHVTIIVGIEIEKRTLYAENHIWRVVGGGVERFRTDFNEKSYPRYFSGTVRVCRVYMISDLFSRKSKKNSKKKRVKVEYSSDNNVSVCGRYTLLLTWTT